MYSVVLAVAISTAPGTASWGRTCACYSSCHACTGCQNAYQGYGCYGCHGCQGGTPGVTPQASTPQPMLYGGAGAGYGYHGGCYGAGYGTNSYFDPNSAFGCYGCHGGHSGYGIPVPVDPKKTTKQPVDPFPPLETEKKKEPKGAEEIPAPKEVPQKKTTAPASPESQRAIVRVEIPVGGKLYVDGRLVDVAPGLRVFQTPDLAGGQRYFYDFKIEVQIAGQMMREEKRVIVERGQQVAVEFPTLRHAATETAQRSK